LLLAGVVVFIVAQRAADAKNCRRCKTKTTPPTLPELQTSRVGVGRQGCDLRASELCRSATYPGVGHGDLAQSVSRRDRILHRDAASDGNCAAIGLGFEVCGNGVSVSRNLPVSWDPKTGRIAEKHRLRRRDLTRQSFGAQILSQA
jgi:hypothetical protein